MVSKVTPSSPDAAGATHPKMGVEVDGHDAVSGPTPSSVVLLVATQRDAAEPPVTWTRVHIESPSQFAGSHSAMLASGAKGLFSWGNGKLCVLGHGGESDEAKPRDPICKKDIP